MPIDLQDFDVLTEDYRAARDALGSAVSALEADIAAVKLRHLAEIRARLVALRDADAAVRGAVSDAPETLFAKRRTHTLHGVRFGFIKSKGKLILSDEAKIIERLKKRFGDQADTYVRSKESIVRAALEQLDAKTLKALGVRIVDGGDEIIVKDTAGELDKLIDALLGTELDDAQEVA